MTGGGNDIADETLVAGTVFAGDDRGLGDAIMLTERGLDLAGLDAEAADLDLMVGTAEKMRACPRGASAHGRRCGTCGCPAVRTDRRRNVRRSGPGG